jgi:tetratricopeptide (TPR) repeat protein/plasmid stabilization system protein ParE
MGRGKPFISTENVRAALDRLVYSASHSETNTLEDLLIVSEVVSRPDFPSSSRGREYALNSLLTAAITSHFEQHRRVFNRLLEPPDAPIWQARNEIGLDAQQGAPELLGWGWFYYHYIRADLNFSQQDFSQLTHLDERTLRRYQQHTLRQLTDYLIEQEHMARARQRARRLYSELPTQAQAMLIGRDADRQMILDMLRRNSPRHIQISGMSGVGKSALVERVVRDLIDTDAFEQVVWLEYPPSIDFIRGLLSEKFASEAATASLRDYLSIYPTAVILDDVDHLIQDIEAVELLLQDLSNATVFLIGRSYTPLRNVLTFMLRELSQEAVYQLIEILLPSVQDEQSIWELTGGNPLAIKLAVGHLPLSSHIPHGVEPFLSAVESVLRETEWLAWLAFILLPSNPIAITTLEHLWPGIIDDNQVTGLVRHHVIEALEIPPEHCLLTPAARQYLIGRYQTDVGVRDRVHQLLASLSQADIPLEMIEHLLLAQWLQLADTGDWQRHFWQQGVNKGHWGVWKTILQNAPPEVADLRIAYGICLRSLGEWDTASTVLDDAIRRTGRTGDFVTQAYALLEEAKVRRYQGHFQNALNLLARAERTLLRQQETALLQEVKLEQVRIAVEQNQVEAGFKILSSMPKSLASQFLWAEVYLLAGDYSRCRQLADDALQRAHDSHVLARLHTLIGRCYEREKDLYNAQNYFFAAVSLLEQLHDPFALARAQSNLAAVYIRMNQQHDARILLQEAQHSQTRLKDVVGLAATRHNIGLLAPG